MIAALTTLLFLTILWMLGVLAMRTATESGTRIARAMDGIPPALTQPRRRVAA